MSPVPVSGLSDLVPTGNSSDVVSASSSMEREPGSPHDAAVAMQKLYRGYRTRRQLADCAVIARDYDWWNVLEGVILRQNSEQFYGDKNHKGVAARWNRLGKKAAKLGRGLSKDETARKLAFQHWLEAIDARHRYGHNLNYYFDAWKMTDTLEPFFHWLDVGGGRAVDLAECPRAKLNKDQISYLGPRERKQYEVSIEDGKWYYNRSHELIDTSGGDRWIFVMSPSQAIYVGKKKKGKFQHSSFLAGGAAKAAGRLKIRNGILEVVEPHSGHYRPTKKNFQTFLNILQERGIDLDKVKVHFQSEEMSTSLHSKSSISREHSVQSLGTLAQELQEEAHKAIETKVVQAFKETEELQDVAAEETRPEPRKAAGEAALVQEKQQQQVGVEGQQQQVSVEGQQQVGVEAGRPLGLQERRRQWCSGAGCRLSSLSIIPSTRRAQALEEMRTPHTPSTVRW